MSCKIAAITAFLQQTVIVKITNRLTVAAGFLASNFLTVDPEACRLVVQNLHAAVFQIIHKFLISLRLMSLHTHLMVSVYKTDRCKIRKTGEQSHGYGIALLPVSA